VTSPPAAADDDDAKDEDAEHLDITID